MVIDVEVALHMVFFGFSHPPDLEVPDFDASWAERPRVSLRVEGTTTLAEVLDVAAAKFGIEPDEEEWRYTEGDISIGQSLAGVTFHQSRSGFVPSKGHRHYPILDTEGVARWDVDVMDAQMTQLVDAHQAGLIAGDPRRPYLIPQIPGGAADFDWQAIGIFLGSLKDVVETIGGIGAGILVLKGVIVRGVDVIEGARERWAARGGSLHDVAQIAQNDELEESDVAQLLGVDTDEALQLRALTGTVDPDVTSPTSPPPGDATNAAWALIAAAQESALWSLVESESEMKRSIREALDYIDTSTNVDPDRLRQIFAAASRHALDASHDSDPLIEDA